MLPEFLRDVPLLGMFLPGLRDQHGSPDLYKGLHFCFWYNPEDNEKGSYRDRPEEKEDIGSHTCLELEQKRGSRKEGRRETESWLFICHTHILLEFTLQGAQDQTSRYLPQVVAVVHFGPAPRPPSPG